LRLVRVEVFLVVLRIGPPWIREASGCSKLLELGEQLRPGVTSKKSPQRFILDTLRERPVTGHERPDVGTREGLL